jgi:hypothetical protein
MNFTFLPMATTDVIYNVNFSINTIDQACQRYGSQLPNLPFDPIRCMYITDFMNVYSGVNMAALVLQLSLQAASEYRMYAFI